MAVVPRRTKLLQSPCAGAPNPAKQRAGVGGAMRPLMINFGFRFGLTQLFLKGLTGEAVDGPAGSGGVPRVSSGHVLSETAGARRLFQGDAA